MAPGRSGIMHDRGLTKSVAILFFLFLFALGFGAFLIPNFPLTLRAAEIDRQNENLFRILTPITSGELTIFPVIRTTSFKTQGWQYITLDEGLSSGEVVVTEAGRAQGLVRTRHPGVWSGAGSGDQVNRLVLVNNSSKPLILLAGEIVTGGKQDRVIAKDRIVPPQSDPIDLSVFCIEPGRWIATSEQFGTTGKPTARFMAQPLVRKEAMVARDQQQVWNAVDGAINSMVSSGTATSETIDGGFILQHTGPNASTPSFNKGLTPTTSYAKTMEQTQVQQKVDQAGQMLLQSREQILAKLRQEHAVGVVAAIRGEIVWADLFADPELLAKYWTKLIRSYAAEVLTSYEQKAPATVADAQRFLDSAVSGRETSEGEVGVYRYSEVRDGNVTSFVLRTLLPGTDFDVHISKVRTDSKATPTLTPIVRPR
jgi:ARG/rhodanese/phosphatase superfamily protein